MGLEDQETEEVHPVPGQTLSCQICGHTRFWRRDVLLNTFLATFFGFDWANRSADCFICEKCRHIHWFLRR
jgi:hypothetical protein